MTRPRAMHAYGIRSSACALHSSTGRERRPSSLGRQDWLAARVGERASARGRAPAPYPASPPAVTPLSEPPTRGSWAAAASAPSASAAFAWPAFLSLRRLARAGRQRRRGAERRRRRRQRPAATRRAGPHQRRARGRVREPPLACTCQKPVQLRKPAVSEGICLLCPARLRARCGPHGRRKPKTRCPSDARSARTRARAVARPRRATRTDDWRWECCVRQDHCGRPFLPPPRCEWVGVVAQPAHATEL